MEMTRSALAADGEPPGSGGAAIGAGGEEINLGWVSRVVGSTDAVAEIGRMGVWLKRLQQGCRLEEVRWLGGRGSA